MPTPPKTWTRYDLPPNPAEMAEYLSRIRAIQEALPRFPGAPELPPDMGKLTFSEANDIETVLLYADTAITCLEKSRVYSGEMMSGGF